MNLPNKLTVLRVIMVPFFVFFMLTDVGGPANKWIALILFCVASLTDMLDGKIARKYNLVTNFGKFMDPLADKLLVCSAMICMIEMGKLPARRRVFVPFRQEEGSESSAAARHPSPAAKRSANRRSEISRAPKPRLEAAGRHPCIRRRRHRPKRPKINSSAEPPL